MRSAQAKGHLLGEWDQRGQTAAAVCVRCGRTVVADFSREAAEGDREVRGAAIVEDCDVAIS